MNKIFFFLACAILFVYIAHADDEREYGMFRCSIEKKLILLLLLGADDAQQFLQKRLFGIPFPREQRREAKEKYEER